MLPRTTGAIALRPTGSAQGGHYFYSLTTGKRINRNQWTVLPMPADVIQRIDRLCCRPLDLPTLEFADRAGVLADHVDHDNHNDNIDDNDDDYDPAVDDDTIAGVDDDDDNDEIDNDGDDNDEIDNEAAIVENIAIVDNVNNLELELEIELEEMAGVNFEDVAEEEEAAEVAEEVVEVIEDVAIENEEEVEIDKDEIEEDDENEIDVNARMDALYGPRTGRHDLWARKARDYGHLHATTLESTAMTQHRCARPFILIHSSRFTSLSYCPAQHVDALAGPSQNSNESFVASMPLFGPGRKFSERKSRTGGHGGK